ncbi:uncharacterized protein CCOS01_09224 [Colletotrichum costaricense]|uniref:Uncharacterized protein n=1 Tax=Colletotrichum costaricense TaxID=1209916 RepID=A0AAI9YV01_9PEZI|nr:uncharacterized protein CCOS01_09224 [Colletotrichum costaricense]KAK1524137.1 hypothetical protein CCOS01_09224 [Colletotrichum costaricense]
MYLSSGSGCTDRHGMPSVMRAADRPLFPPGLSSQILM